MIDRTRSLRILIGTGLLASVWGGALHFRPASPTESTDCCAITEDPSKKPESQPALAAAPPIAQAADLSAPPTVPDTPVVDQHGRPLRFYSDLVRDQVIAVSFIFTTCKGVCPPIGANVASLARESANRDVRFISISVDPVNDTPARLARWSETFGAAPNWTLLTGAKRDVDALLKAVGGFSADKANHSPLILVGNDRTKIWRRVGGLSAPETIQTSINSVRPAPADRGSDTAESEAPAQRYFTDVLLTDQNGESKRFYSDLLRGKTVVIHVFFASCKNTCPMVMATFQKLQDNLGDRLGRDVHLLSLTVDPEHDDAAAIADYARRVNPRRGWYLLTGTKENVRFVLAKLGQSVARPEEHSNVFLVGNEPTQLWKKVRGLDPVEQISQILDGVIADTGEPVSSASAAFNSPKR